MSAIDSYKSPLRKLVKFFEKSRDEWKQKSMKNKAENQRLKRKINTLLADKEKWKAEAILLRRELKAVKQQASVQESELDEIKKTVID